MQIFVTSSGVMLNHEWFGITISSFMTLLACMLVSGVCTILTSLYLSFSFLHSTWCLFSWNTGYNALRCYVTTRNWISVPHISCRRRVVAHGNELTSPRSISRASGYCSTHTVFHTVNVLLMVSYTEHINVGDVSYGKKIWEHHKETTVVFVALGDRFPVELLRQ